MPIGLDSSATSDLIFATLPSPAAVFQLRHDTFDLPRGATWLAYSDAVANQAFRCGRAVYGVPFHPEMAADMVRERSADAGIPVAPDTASCCAGLARMCGRMVGGWSAPL
jgi:GMP synthase-like glutamine amidotransferase